MIITEFIRDRSDVELVRLAREDARWRWLIGWRDRGNAYSDQPGCILCNSFDLRTRRDYQDAKARFQAVEAKYMLLAEAHGDAETGAMIARLATRELARRDSAVFATLEPPGPGALPGVGVGRG